MQHPYATDEYAHALSHWGEALSVPEWSTNVIVREIKPGFKDASGTYPIAILDKNADIPGGLERLRQHQLISVVLVLDDFHRPTLEKLDKHFTIIKPFKTHYIYEKKQGAIVYNHHHRYELRQALKSVRVDLMNLEKSIDEWTSLYTNLITKKKLTGLHSFPKTHHSALIKLNGVTPIGAWHNNKLVSCHIWVSDNQYAHSHLAASSDQGYACRAAYAINDAAITYFSNLDIINFGGGITEINHSMDGLAKFKQGFSNNTKSSFICGAILDQRRYNELLLQNETMIQTDFFPSYRKT